MLPFRWFFASLLIFVAAACGPNPPSSNDAGVPDSGSSIDPGPPSCTDGIRNGDEGDVDCGGSCGNKCDNGQRCYANADCAGDLCSDGVCVECTHPSQCPGNDTECTVRTCVANKCGTSNVADGAPSNSQTRGDCQVRQCDGNGNAVSVADDTDLPADDGNACTSDICNAGVPTHPNLPVDTACNQNGGSVCNAAGACVACNTAQECPGSDTECAVRTCVSGACGFSYTAPGTPVTAQTANDCQSNQCDGNGNVVSVADDTDVPADDGNACTLEACTAGVPSHPSAPADTACSQNGGAVCDGSGACVACNTASQCPGSDTECAVRTCTAGVCGVAFTAAGSQVTTQLSGDCRVNQCDGNGNVVAVAEDSDLPADDGNPCTLEACNAGVVSHPNAAVDTACNQNGGTVCNGSGACVACNTASQCPGSDTECAARTCTAGVCGSSFTTAGTQVASQTSGDCQVNQCDGNGNIVSVADNTDVPADDGSECTTEVCNAGVPSHANKPVDTACSQNGGTFCSTTGTCVACNLPTQCPGTDTACSFRACLNNSCTMETVNPGVATSTQIPGDCQVSQCDGTGSVVSVADDTDVPADDGNQCTTEACNAGVPVHPAATVATTCNQNGGAVCDGTGLCVQCIDASQCPGADTECQTRTCNQNACGLAFTSAGTLVTSQTAGDCQVSECDGSGNVVAVADNTDVPSDDGNACTADVCTSGAPAHPAVAFGTPCGSAGVCDGAGSCVTAPTVVATSPADGASYVGAPKISVTFSTAMDPATLTGQTVAGPCSGSIQVSDDGFASCVAFGSAAAALSSGNTVATFTAVPGLLVNHTYKVKVTTAAQSAAGLALASAFAQPAGFGFSYAGRGVVVISQVYGGGGNSSATYQNDFVELHNRGGDTVDLTGMTVQYASASGTTWTIATLTGTIPAGGYYLVQLKSNGTTGATLPAADASNPNLDMSATAGKVALVASATALSGSCPTAGVIDFVGFGTTANCSEGGTPAPAPSATKSVIRAQSGCVDRNANNTDFSAVTPAPRNSTTSAALCVFPARNESGDPLEADYCTLSPTSLSVQTGATASTISGEIYEAGMTEAAGANASVMAQVGYGPVTANPEYEPGWTWVNATWNTQVNDNDQYQATFTAPAPGTWQYGYRFSLDNGATWTYCGTSGAGSSLGYTFTLQSLGVMTVTP